METKLRILILLLACYQMLFTNYTAFPEAIQQDPYLILVRRDHALTRAFQPEVVIPKVPAARAAAARHIALQPEAATALEDMFAQAKQEGHTLYAVSGYRSYAAQANVYRSKVKAVGKKEAEVYVAAPGVSEHQTGLAIDVNGEHTLTEGLTESFAMSPEGQWIAANAYCFGFVIRYPKGAEKITGYAWEPWHLRYVGKAHAEAMQKAGISLEEYLLNLQIEALTLRIREKGWIDQPSESI